MYQFSSIKSISVRHPQHSTHFSHNLSNQQKSTYSSNSSKIKNESIQNNLSQRQSCNTSRCESTEQTRKSFRPNDKSQIHTRKLIDKVVSKCQQNMKIGQVLSMSNVVDIFICLGYFNDPLSIKDRQSIKLINSLLSHENRGINKHNLLRLIYIIANIPLDLDEPSNDTPCLGLKRDNNDVRKNQLQNEIGFFDPNNIWVLSKKQEKLIKSKLGHLYYNRISNTDVKYRKQFIYKQHSFEPKILPNSSRISLKRRRQLSSLFNLETNTIDQRDLINKKKQTQWIQKQKSISKEKQLLNCAFKPQVNQSQVTSRYSSRGQYTSRSSINYDKKQQTQLKQCTFKPKLTCYKQNINSPAIKNSSKTIKRLQQAYKRKVQVDTYKQRGYLKSKFVSSSQNVKKTFDKSPLLAIDIKIHNSSQNLSIFEGELLENLVCKILVKNKLPYDYMEKVQQLLQEIIGQSETASIINGFISSK